MKCQLLSVTFTQSSVHAARLCLPNNPKQKELVPLKCKKDVAEKTWTWRDRRKCCMSALNVVTKHTEKVKRTFGAFPQYTCATSPLSFTWRLNWKPVIWTLRLCLGSGSSLRWRRSCPTLWTKRDRARCLPVCSTRFNKVARVRYRRPLLGQDHDVSSEA